MRTALALRHLAFEDLGLIEPWLRRRGWQVVYYDVGVDELWKIDLTQVDLLAVLGGPIGAHEDDRYPFLTEELQMIRTRLESGLPLLGICLGAQLMARALGAQVKPMAHKEIGYSALTLSPESCGSPIALIGQQPVLHWHGDQFAMPQGIHSLAATPACPHQAFVAGPRAMAWQFHLEVDAARIQQWLIGHTGELTQQGIDLHALRDAACTTETACKRPWMPS
jgi:GMP synthase (glutamine-hydrolysing)